MTPPGREKFALVALLSLLGGLARGSLAQAREANAGSTRHALTVDGRPRSYLVHLPAKYDPKKPTPVVLIFHGAWMNAAMMEGLTDLDKKADSAGFIAVYLNGFGFGEVALFFNSWSDPTRADRNWPDDVKFSSKVLDDLGTTANIDPKRVYATGLSNGGMMCYRLAAELSDRIAAIAPVSGTVAIARSNPTRPVPVIHFHGSADKIVPYAGPNPNTPGFLKFKSVDASIALWVKLDDCPAEPVIRQIPDAAHDGMPAEETIYGPGKDGAEVILYTIANAGHSWPGRPMPVKALGPSTMNISANDLIWSFFEKHPMK